MSAQWEYAVETLGRAPRGAQPDELAELPNYAAGDSRELMHVLVRKSNRNQIMIVLRREV